MSNNGLNLFQDYKKGNQILNIMLTGPCNVDPLTSHFSIVKLGFTVVYIFLNFIVCVCGCHRLNCDHNQGGVMGSVLMCIFSVD